MRHTKSAAALILSVALFSAIAASPCRAIELVHYAFDQVDTDGIIFTTPDASGRNNTGTLTSMDTTNLVTGRLGGALSFVNGSSAATRDRVEVITAAPNPDPIITDLNRTYTQFTFAALVKPVDIPESANISFIAGKIGNSPNRGWQIGWTGTSPATNQHEIVVSLFDGPTNENQTNEIYSGPTTAIANGTWAHVAFTFSGVNETEQFLRIYINGQKVSEMTPATAVPLTLALMNGINLRNFQVGNRGDQRLVSWNGLIDDVHLYDNALTDAQITALLPPPFPLGDFDENGLVDAADYLVWRKNEGSSTALPNDNGLGTPIGALHYDLWRSHFGAPSGSGSGLASEAAVPEPSTALLTFGAVFAFASSKCRRGNRLQ